MKHPAIGTPNSGSGGPSPLGGQVRRHSTKKGPAERVREALCVCFML